VKYIELTLDEYRARHVAKIKSRNAWLERQRAKANAAKREAVLDLLGNVDPAKLAQLLGK
jgi:hypothetical protein